MILTITAVSGNGGPLSARECSYRHTREECRGHPSVAAPPPIGAQHYQNGLVGLYKIRSLL